MAICVICALFLLLMQLLPLGTNVIFVSLRDIIVMRESKNDYDCDNDYWVIYKIMLLCFTTTKKSRKRFTSFRRNVSNKQARFSLACCGRVWCDAL